MGKTRKHCEVGREIEVNTILRCVDTIQENVVKLLFKIE